MTDTEKKFGFSKRTWMALKAVGPASFYVKWPINKSGAHPGAKHGKKIERRHALKTGKWGRILAFETPRSLTNHARCQMRRAAKMKISLTEYKRRFCAGVQ
jgi:hypothetical protein